MTNGTNGSAVKWVAIIISVLSIFVAAAFATLNGRVAKHDELIMEMIRYQQEVKSDLKYIRERIDQTFKEPSKKGKE
jgi:hypothetical protein